jgi:hypothetical protein
LLERSSERGRVARPAVRGAVIAAALLLIISGIAFAAKGGRSSGRTNRAAAYPPPPPSNVFPPSISGSASQGQALTELHGTWTNAPTSYSYQWEDYNGSGQACAAIAGATGPSYMVTGPDVGHTIVVQETASNPGGSGIPASSTPTAVVLPAVPSNVLPPTIAGTSTQGQTLIESHGTWINNPASYTYAWYDCNGAGGGCVPISGAGGQSYTLTAADVRHTIRVSETAGNAGGTSAVFSAATALVQPATGPPVAPSTNLPPVVNGVTIVGHSLSSSTGLWFGSTPISYAFQWQRCTPRCKDIAGATSSSYKLSHANLGARVRALVTAMNGAGSRQAFSSQVGPVAAGISPAQIRALLSNALRVHGTLATIGQVLKHGGYTLSLRVPGAGKLTILWYFKPSHRTRILVAGVTVTFRTSGQSRIRLVLTSKGRKLLMEAKHLKLSVTGKFKPIGATQASSTKTLTLTG